ncbi:kelch-like protein 23 [Bufo gargarizans]|uniref:kelch-like protein 23 n=1 Tax=Bufo gargarizans TaxID=30331 RepID=UPI001CF3D06E|nr:kelch-like protein 23 [Bufo gargarizans]
MLKAKRREIVLLRPEYRHQKGNLVIVTGGYFRGDFVWYSIDWVLIYDSSDNCWRDGPPMKISRNCHCAVGIGLHLYVIGGSTDEGVVADVERLNLAEMTWESRKPLIRPVERAAAVSVDSRLYVICGRDENGDVYSGIQMLNTKTDVWNVITYSPMPRLAGSLASSKHKCKEHSIEADPDSVEGTHTLQPGDLVVIKRHVRKGLDPRFDGPFQVLLTTHTAVKVEGKPNWIHASHCKKILMPKDEDPPADGRPNPGNSDTVPTTEG